MGSAAWFIGNDGAQWVAKADAAEAGGQLAGGLRLAQRLERAGIPAGAPLPTASGQLAVNQK